MCGNLVLYLESRYLFFVHSVLFIINYACAMDIFFSFMLGA
jgi:hypothetical protein